MNGNKDTVEKILTSVFNLPDNTVFEDLEIDSITEWDSMKQLTIITAIENEFDIFIDASDANKLTSYNSIIEFLNNHPETD